MTGNPVVDALQTLNNVEPPAEMSALLEKIGVTKEGRQTCSGDCA